MQLHIVVVAGGLLLLISVACGGYEYYLLNAQIALGQGQEVAHRYQAGQLIDKMKAADILNSNLTTELAARTQETDTIAGQVQSLATGMTQLTQLAATDKELLEKYSGVYFLNENYIPPNLMQIDAQFVYQPDKDQYFLGKIYPHLLAMLSAAKADGVDLRVQSAYRSFGTQSALKSDYSARYGSGANAFSADQGYSEHQLGTTADFTVPILKGALAPASF